MTKLEFIKMKNEYGLRNALYEIPSDEIWTYEDMKQYAIDCIIKDDLFIAIHVLTFLDNVDNEDMIRYDSCMGVLESPSVIGGFDDVEDLLEEEEEEQ